MIFPTVHLNGTGRQALLDQLCEASAAINDALKALSNAMPNGRDYYTQPGNAISTAIVEHSARVAALVKVRDELMEIAEHIIDA